MGTRVVGIFLSLLVCQSAWPFGLQELLDHRLDPSLRWKTVETPHFEIHYPVESEALAQRVTATAEKSHDKVTQALGHEPAEKTHIVLFHKSDEPSVFTFLYPHPQIFYDVALPPPSLGLNDFVDWNDWLITHEYSHIVQIGARSGFYSWLHPFFGSSVTPSNVTPPWLKEGLAVFEESRLTPRGRGDSPLYRMMIRTAVRDGLLGTDPNFASPDTIANFDNEEWPWTVRPYLLGYYLMKELHSGSDAHFSALVDYLSAAVPFRLDSAIEAAGAGDFDTLWSKTLDHARSDARAELEKIAREPLTRLQYVTHTGQVYAGLRISPNGEWLAATRDIPEQDNAILVWDLKKRDAVSKPRPLIYRTSGANLSFSRSSRFVALDQLVKYRRSYLSGEIVIVDLATGAVVSQSRGLRARDPDIHPDGVHIVFVRNDEGTNRLMMTDNAWQNPVEILGGMEFRRLSEPRISPDGSQLVVVVHNDRNGGEDLWLVDLATKTHRVLISDSSLNMQPTWTEDGAYLLFSSDKTGVSNLYAYQLQGGRFFRITNVEGGLFNPALDLKNRWLYAISYGGKGYDIARLRWDPASWKRVEIVSAPAPRTPAAIPPAPTTASTDYHSLSHLAPQYLAPSIVIRPDSYQIGGRVGAADPLFFQHYELDVRYDHATGLPVGRFFYYNGTLPTAFDLSAEQDSYPLAGSSLSLKSLNLRAAADVPLQRDETALHLRPAASARWVRYGANDLGVGPTLGLRYDTQFTQIGQNFAEYGSLLQTAFSRLWESGSGARQVWNGEFLARTHQAVAPRYVFHLSLIANGFAGPELGPNDFYSLGGVRSFPYSLGSSMTLFGYPENSLLSPRAAVGEALFTFPLWEIQRGIGASPIYFGRLSGGLRIQASAIDGISHGMFPADTPWSAGAELHQAILAGYIFDLHAQLGVYRGGTAFGGETQFYFMLSSSDSGS